MDPNEDLRELLERNAEDIARMDALADEVEYLQSTLKGRLPTQDVIDRQMELLEMLRAALIDFGIPETEVGESMEHMSNTQHQRAPSVDQQPIPADRQLPPVRAPFPVYNDFESENSD